MSTRLALAALLALLVLGCSGGSGTPTPTPGGAPTVAPGGGPTATPGGAPTVAPGGGNLEAKARSLVPPGATEVAELDAGTGYSLTVTTSTPIDQLESFWNQAIPGAGITKTGSFTMDGILTIALSNPDGGIIATPDESGLVTILISLGTSS